MHMRMPRLADIVGFARHAVMGASCKKARGLKVHDSPQARIIRAGPHPPSHSLLPTTGCPYPLITCMLPGMEVA